LPTTNIGPVLVAEVAEVWIWVSTSFYTGYRSPLCGRPLDGHTVAPLPNEVDAVGGILQKSAYAALWGYAQENGLVLTQANWEARRGGHYFVNIDATTFRVPDLRDMFRRFTGTDADTANARVLGSVQRDAVQQITGLIKNLAFQDQPTAASSDASYVGTGAFSRKLAGSSGGASVYPTAATSFPDGDEINFDSARVVRSAMETRPVNVAYHPRIHA